MCRLPDSRHAWSSPPRALPCSLLCPAGCSSTLLPSFPSMQPSSCCTRQSLTLTYQPILLLTSFRMLASFPLSKFSVIPYLCISIVETTVFTITPKKKQRKKDLTMATFAIKTQILCFCIPPKSLINACMERENSTLILRPHLVLLSQHTRSVREGCTHRKETPTQRHTLASCIYIICRFKQSQARAHSSTVQLVFHSLTFLPLSCVC